MSKNERKRTMVYSNVNKKKKADKKSASEKDDVIDLDNEIIIGLARFPEPEVSKKEKKIKNNKKVKKVETETKKIVQAVPQKTNSKGQVVQDVPQKTKKIKKTNSNGQIVQTKNKKINEKAIPVQQKIKKQKIRAIRRMTMCFFLLMVLIGGFIYFLLSPVFNVKTIEVLNNNYILDEQLINLSSIKLNENMFKFSKKEVKNNILKNPYIESVDINRKMFSNKVEIDVKERVATLMLEYGNSYVYINNQGYILEISTIKLNSPIIKGYKTPLENIVPGNRLSNEDLKRLEMVLQIIEVAKSNELDELITKIDVEDTNDYMIIFETEGKTAYLGSCSQLSTQMLNIKEILLRNEGIDGKIFVDMDLNEKNPVFRWDI